MVSDSAIRIHNSYPQGVREWIGDGMPDNDTLWMTCQVCGRTWDDGHSTSWTPTPSGRCPFEYDHKDNKSNA